MYCCFFPHTKFDVHGSESAKLRLRYFSLRTETISNGLWGLNVQCHQLCLLPTEQQLLCLLISWSNFEVLWGPAPAAKKTLETLVNPNIPRQALRYPPCFVSPAQCQRTGFEEDVFRFCVRLTGHQSPWGSACRVSNFRFPFADKADDIWAEAIAGLVCHVLSA